MGLIAKIEAGLIALEIPIKEIYQHAELLRICAAPITRESKLQQGLRSTCGSNIRVLDTLAALITRDHMLMSYVVAVRLHSSCR